MKKQRKRMQDMKNKKMKTSKGITLIALVITIIVLLILAGVSIATLTGQNGILMQASNAKVQNSHAQVYEALKLEEQNYQIEAKTGTTQTDIITYLTNKGIIDSNLIVNVTKLLGTSSATGNGTGITDVYKLEEVTSLGKLASVESVKIASTGTNKTYTVVYYNESGERLELGTISDGTASSGAVIEPVEPENISDWIYKEVTEGSETYIQITGYQGSGPKVVVPNYINGIPVKVVEPESQSGRESFSIWEDSICLVEGLYYSASTIAEGTITEVTVSEGIERVGDMAFAESAALVTLNLPSTLKELGCHIIYYCPNLENLNIPYGITNIGDQAFEEYSSYPEKLTTIKLPESVTSIGYSAFGGRGGLEEITIPSRVESIADNAFLGCDNLTEITIPDGVTTMGAYVFEGRYTTDIVVNVPFKEGETPEGWDDNWNSFDSSAFWTGKVIVNYAQ